jgi:sec-independent protein translocase protein TatA
MPNWLSGPEIIVILVIVVLLFGVGRIGKVFGELGKGIREFRREVKGDTPDQPVEDQKKEDN